MPSSVPAGSVTATAETPRSAKRRAMAATGVSGGTLATSVVIRSRARSVVMTASFLLRQKLPLYLGFFEFVHNARRRGRALLGALVAALVG